MMTRDYKTLDAIVVIGSLILMGYAMWALITREIPQAQLAILSGIIGAQVGSLLTLYAGSRWGNQKPNEDKAKTPGAASVSLEVTQEPPVDKPN